MAATESKMISLGSKAPDFSLSNGIDNKFYSLSDLKGKNGTLILFICNHCPYVIHIIKHFVSLSKKLIKNEVGVIAISSNDIINYPEDSPSNMLKFSKKYNFSFPYLFDESQDVAKKYDAACTPDFFLYDKNLSLFYRGRYDKSRPNNNEKLNALDLNEAFNYMIENKKFTKTQYPSLGCNIKWK